MKTAYLDIPHKKWGVVVVYDYDTQGEYVEVMAVLRSFGLPLYKAKQAMRILSAYNTGMAVSVDELKMSVVFIGKATSASEWWSTALHELKHSADAIISYYDVEWDGEDSAYLTGYLTKQLVEQVAEPCR
jgi:hypothetical protein